jgi:hypothetical protein
MSIIASTQAIHTETALLWNLKQCEIFTVKMLTEKLLNIYKITRRHTTEALLLYTSGLLVLYENFELTQVQQEATWK